MPEANAVTAQAKTTALPAKWIALIAVGGFVIIYAIILLVIHVRRHKQALRDLEWQWKDEPYYCYLRNLRDYGDQELKARDDAWGRENGWIFSDFDDIRRRTSTEIAFDRIAEALKVEELAMFPDFELNTLQIFEEESDSNEHKVTGVDPRFQSLTRTAPVKRGSITKESLARVPNVENSQRQYLPFHNKKRLYYQERFREPPRERLAGTTFPGRNKRNPRRASETLTPQQAHARTKLIQEQVAEISLSQRNYEPSQPNVREQVDLPQRSSNPGEEQYSNKGDILLDKTVAQENAPAITTAIARSTEEPAVITGSPSYTLTPQEGEISTGVIGTLGQTSGSNATVVPGENAGERGVFVTTFHPVDDQYSL